MSEAEKMAAEIEDQVRIFERTSARKALEAAAMIQRLAAENEALRAKQARLVEQTALMKLALEAVERARMTDDAKDWQAATDLTEMALIGCVHMEPRAAIKEAGNE